MSKPEYDPEHTVPVWLGSNQVISELLKMDGCKSTLWDVLCMVRRLEAESWAEKLGREVTYE